ncbi:MAG: hypothetical protein ACI8XM_000932 [Haloarculaceae archaeon]|jgi:hypothetical protein
MYERKTADEHVVEWNPENDSLAKIAINDVDGTEVPGTYTLPDDASVPVDEPTAKKVRRRYYELINNSLQITLSDGEVTGDGVDEELVTIEVLDADGNRTHVSPTVIFEIDGETQEVETDNGVGEAAVTTTKDSGSTVSVQATAITDPSMNLGASNIKDISVV